MNPIDPYDLIDLDFEEFMRRGRETYGIAEKEAEDEHDGI